MGSIKRTIPIVLLALIVLVGLVLLVIWRMPKNPVFTVEDASIQGFNIANNHLNATFNFVFRAYNFNTTVSIYYDKVKVSVSYDKETLASNTVDPFFHPRWNVTNKLKEKIVAQNVLLTRRTMAKDLGLEKAAGVVELDVRMNAKVRFKVGMWKSKHRRLRIFCSPIFVLSSSSSNSSGTTSCHTSLSL